MRCGIQIDLTLQEEQLSHSPWKVSSNLKLVYGNLLLPSKIKIQESEEENIYKKEAIVRFRIKPLLLEYFRMITYKS